MNVKIWKLLSQILYYRNDLYDIIKPFFENLKNENINDEKFFPLLKTFSYFQLEALYQNGIITEEKFNSSKFKTNNNEKSQDNIQEKNENHSFSDIIEDLLSQDQIQKFQELIQDKDIDTFNQIIKSFKEVKQMVIPLLQYCIIKNAIRCFKYLLVNGYGDPNRVMIENVSYRVYRFMTESRIKRYEWDCMATAIYFGNMEIVKILEVKGINKCNSGHIEAAILSYRNEIAKEIMDEINETKDKIESLLSNSIIASAKNNNIKGTKLLLQKGANTNIDGYNVFN